MSKNVSIQVNGIPQSYNDVTQINTQSMPLGNAQWFPSDEVVLMDKQIVANGTYDAQEDDGVYGYGKVTVDVNGRGDYFTAKDSETGQEYKISVDSEGNIVKEPVVEPVVGQQT